MDRKDQHKKNVSEKMASVKGHTPEARMERNRIAHQGVVDASRAIVRRLGTSVPAEVVAEVNAELDYMEKNIPEIVAGTEHGL